MGSTAVPSTGGGTNASGLQTATTTPDAVNNPVTGGVDGSEGNGDANMIVDSRAAAKRRLEFDVEVDVEAEVDARVRVSVRVGVSVHFV